MLDAALLARLAAHFGGAAPDPLPPLPPRDRIDLRRDDDLVARDDPALGAGLERLLDGAADLADLDRRLASRLAACADQSPAQVDWHRDAQALVTAWAGRHDGTAVQLQLGPGLAPAVPGFEGLTPDQLAERLPDRSRPIGCVLVELRGDPQTDDRLQGLLWALRAARIPVAADERRTAFRTVARTVRADLPPGVRPAAVLLGRSAAMGLPFAALVHDGPALDVARDDQPPAATRAVALATLETLLETPVAARCADAGRTLRERLLRQATDDDVQLEWLGPDALPALVFAGQENAEAPLMAHHFQLELAARGLDADADLLVGPDPDTARRAATILAAATARIRCLLIEHNSWLSGGLPWCFGTAGAAPAPIRERQLCRYRYPKPADVSIEPSPDRDGVRIAFGGGDIGPITSSGFYLPTRLVGDLEITIRYTILAWEPGPDSACLGFFLQNEASSARYYAQVMTTSNKPEERAVAAGLEGGLTGRMPLDGAARETGYLRLRRTGRRLSAWFRAPDATATWQEIGSIEPATDDPLICGAKIWSKVRCGALVADLTELRIDATPGPVQDPVLEYRPDPRGA